MHDSKNIFGLSEDSVSDVLAEFLTELDPRLLDLGWGFTAAKSVEYGLTDQSMANHVRNGVFAITRLNDVVPAFGAYELSDDELRQVIALFVIHDLHKLRGETTARTEYDIDMEEVEALITKLGVDEFAPSLRIEDFHACAVDHENSWKSNPEQSTRTYDKFRPFVRVADAFASCATPEEAASARNVTGLAEAYPSVELELRHHSLDDVKGVFTNILNGVVSKYLAEHAEYKLLLIYQDGCVYLADSDTPKVMIEKEFIEEVYDHLRGTINTVHPAYTDHQKLASNFSFLNAQGRYKISDQDFFYVGASPILYAATVRGVQDADPDTEPTPAMRETIGQLNEHISKEIDTSNRIAVGYARLAHTIKSVFIDPLSNAGLVKNSLNAICEIFNVSETLRSELRSINSDPEIDLTAGGKWDYSYVIGQRIADLARQNGWSPIVPNLANFVLEGLEDLAEEWDDAVMTERTGEFETEIRAYITTILRVDGWVSEKSTEEAVLSDPFEEHHSIRRGKTCTFCNGGTASTRKSDMEAPKSLTTFKAGYSNRIPADATKPDNLLVCIPCQVEFSLRETGATRREADRLFIHLVPDYFYTPAMWSLYADEVFARFTGEAMTRMGRLASAVFDVVTEQSHDGSGTSATDESTLSESMTTVLREATRADDAGGRSMIEQLSQDFKTDAGFGTRTLSFYKPQDNETEFQFFGVFIGLAVASAMGLRAYISHSPLPDMRGRDFSEMVKLDAGFTAVAEFYGSEIPLSCLRGRLGAAAALIQLGYTLARDDARFPKYLRVTRNKPLPGSYLLKRVAQTADDSGTARYLLEEADYLDEHVNAAAERDDTVTIENSER